jgi:transcription initiation factor TFIID subunit 2
MTKWWRIPALLEYVLSVIINDNSRVIRRHVARTATQSFAILAQMGELKNGTKDNDALLIEEDGNMPEKAKEAAKKSELDQMIRALRKDKELGKSNKLRDFLMPILM